MKKILLLFVLALSFGAFPAVSAAAQPITVQVNGWDLGLELSPVWEKGRVLVPVRQVSEALDAKVVWDAATGTVIIVDVNNQLKLVVGSTTAYQNGREVKLDVPATLKNGRTLVPIRFISETLGAKVEWQKERQLVSVNNGYRYHRYLKSSLHGNEYWLHTQGGELYLLQGTGLPEKIGSLELTLADWGSMSAEETPEGNVLLTILDNYGEPHIHNKVYSVYLRDNKLVRTTMAHYVYRFEENVRFHRNSVVLTDGRQAYLFNDATGEPQATYDLVALGGEEDSYFIEGIGEDFLLIRSNGKGLLTLVYPDTGEKVLLYKELLRPMEQEYAETNDVPFRGDRLHFIEHKDGVLYFRNYSQLQKDDQVYQYPLTER